MKRKKLYYIPGLISIVGLPILLFFFGPEDKIQSTCIRMFIPTDKADLPGTLRFTKTSVYQSIKNKKITTIDLDEPRFDDESNFLFHKKLMFIPLELERLQFTNDTSTVLRVRLGDNNTYGDFIWVDNQLLLYSVKKYAFMDNSYFIFAKPPAIHFPAQELTMDLSSDVLSSDIMAHQMNSSSKWGIFKRYLKESLTKACLIAGHSYIYITGFLLLIMLPGIIRIRKNILSTGVTPPPSP